jgi:rhodanese-related sulfurtransferase
MRGDDRAHRARHRVAPEVTPPEKNERLDDEPVIVASSFGLISAEDAGLLIEANLGGAEFILLDVRTPSGFASGHIPGAVKPDYRGETFSEDGLRFGGSSTILVYRRSRGRSAAAGQVLRDLGFCCAYDMDGGIPAWTGAGYPTE